MDRQTNGQTDEQTNRWMDGWMNGRTDERTNGQTDKRTNNTNPRVPLRLKILINTLNDEYAQFMMSFLNLLSMYSIYGEHAQFMLDILNLCWTSSIYDGHLQFMMDKLNLWWTCSIHWIRSYGYVFFHVTSPLNRPWNNSKVIGSIDFSFRMKGCFRRLIEPPKFQKS